jgi:hypothetical protein
MISDNDEIDDLDFNWRPALTSAPAAADHDSAARSW